MPSVDVNWLAVVAAAAINMVVGMVWYARSVFGKEWMKLTGRKMEDMTGSSTGYAVATIGALLQSWILAHFVVYAGSNTFAEGLVTGFWLWVAFVAVVATVHYAFEGRSWLLWKINAGYFLVVLLINGGLLAIWH